jgi:hypothetical protein
MTPRVAHEMRRAAPKRIDERRVANIESAPLGAQGRHHQPLAVTHEANPRQAVPAAADAPATGCKWQVISPRLAARRRRGAK